jgi:hypothetical protein
MLPEHGTRARRLRILTWHVHGNYLYYLTHTPHDFYLATRPGHPPGYAGRTGVLPWGENVHEIAIDAIAEQRFDVVLYQHRMHWEYDRLRALSDAQRRLPAIYLEHDPPQENAFAQRHWVQDCRVRLIHVTHFNRLMWDAGATPTHVIEHGVVIPAGVRFGGERERGIVVVNHLRQRGRRLGADIFQQARECVPLDLVGMDAQALGGIGEIPNLALAEFCSHYRFFFNPIRWTSLGLAVCEAMMIGMPIVGLATTELSTVIENGVNGFIATDVEALIACMQELLADPQRARRLGNQARETARERFGIERFAHDWDRVLRQAADAGANS